MDTATGASHLTKPPRFETVDLIRGVAVCGILVMNIVSFGMPTAAYLNPNAFLGDHPSTHWLFGLSHILADQKFMGLFSLLFGCSAMLLISKLKASGLNSVRYYYSRTVWLLLFGALHSLLLWDGDILFYYGVCGLFLYPLWRVPPALQFGLGLLIFLSALVFDAVGQQALNSFDQFALESLTPTWSPNPNDIAFETAIRHSSYGDQLSYRQALPSFGGGHPIEMVSRLYSLQGLARAFGFMLMGMAFYSWGIVTGERSRQFYQRSALIGLTLGIPLAGLGLWQNYRHDWQFTYGLFAGLSYNHLATALLVIAYLSGIVLFHFGGRLPHLRRGLVAIGRMAFSNYIGQSLLCTSIFYGHGLSLFGQLNRWQLLLIVVSIWVFQFYFSILWLKHFRYGPLEWLWRALTYCKLVPIKYSLKTQS